jgi:hypothetical protein
MLANSSVPCLENTARFCERRAEGQRRGAYTRGLILYRGSLPEPRLKRGATAASQRPGPGALLSVVLRGDAKNYVA